MRDAIARYICEPSLHLVCSVTVRSQEYNSYIFVHTLETSNYNDRAQLRRDTHCSG